jgi:ElaA protein
VAKKSHRGNGYGVEIVQRAMEILSKKDIKTVLIEAQSHLQTFYESLGFEKISEPYPVDGIPHIKMIHNFSA